MKTLRLNEAMSKINGGTNVFVVTNTPSLVEALGSIDASNLSILTEESLDVYISKDILDSLVTRTVIFDTAVSTAKVKTLENKGYEVFLLLRDNKVVKELVEFATDLMQNNELKVTRFSDKFQNYNTQCDCRKALAGTDAFQYALAEIKRLSGYYNVALIEDYPSLFNTYYGKSRVCCTGDCGLNKGVSSSVDAQLSKEFSEVDKLLYNEGTLLLFNTYAEAFAKLPKADITTREENGRLLNRALKSRTHLIIDILDSLLSRFDTLLTFEEAYYLPATIVKFYKLVYQETDNIPNTLGSYIETLKGGYLDRVYNICLTYNLIKLKSLD